MPLLVEGLSPKLTSDIVNECRSIGIGTVTEFVSSNLEELSKKSKIPYKDLVCIRHDLLSSNGGFPQRADSLYSMLLETMHIISTGNKRIDNLLMGGVYTGEVTEIFGGPAVGKTQFCLSVTADVLLDSENTVLYLDSGRDFTAKRLEQIILQKCEDKQMVTEKLKRVKVIKMKDIYHLLDILDLIKHNLHEMEDEFFKHLRLIAIDSLHQLITPCFGVRYVDGPPYMASIIQSFKLICSGHAVAILVCNLSVMHENSVCTSGLGPNWKYVPSVSLCISKLDEVKFRKLTAVKSCRNGLYKEVNFCITEDGLSD